MSRILFIQKEATEKFGVMTLSAVLKAAGHEVEMSIELLEKEPAVDFAVRYQPDLVAFSITTVEKDWAIAKAKEIKKRLNCLTIFGGAEPTYNPNLIKSPAVDVICRGEGERGFLAVLRRLKLGKSLRGIKNIWFKKGRRIIKNPLGRLYDNLDALPLPDREIYYKYPLLRDLSIKKFLCSRGCPYDCSYCSNHAYRTLFADLGNFIRFRSPEKVIDEILTVKKKYKLTKVYFADETFTLNHQWLYRLLSLYRKKVNLPFSCLARANELDERTVQILAKSGCFYLAFGLESGSPRVRNQILKRGMSDEVLLNAASLLRKYRIPFLTHEMFVLPTETLKDAFETLEMNIKMGTDSVWGTVFQPLRNTRLRQFCLKNKLITVKTKIGSTHGASVIKNPDKKEIENLRKLDWLTIKFPYLLPLIKKLVYLPNNLFFGLSLRLSEVYSFKRRYRLGITEMVKLALGTGDILG